MAVCLNHTDTEAVTRCAACGKPLCAACVAVRDGGDYCSEQCHARGKQAAAQSDAVIGAKAATAKSKKIRLLIVLFIIIAVAAAGAMYYKQNKKEIDSKADAAVRQVKATAAKTEKAVSKEAGAAKQTLNTKSKYKREREALVK
jgi:uncharacterized protein HemX